jgi:hypothetical protein
VCISVYKWSLPGSALVPGGNVQKGPGEVVQPTAMPGAYACMSDNYISGGSGIIMYMLPSCTARHLSGWFS